MVVKIPWIKNLLGKASGIASLSNSSQVVETPKDHAARHKSAGADSIKLNEFAAPTAAVALNAQKITGLADPTANQEAATKKYVDDNAGGDSLWEVDGSETQLKTADEIDMQTKKIINLVDPTAAQHADTKAARDAAIAAQKLDDHATPDDNTDLNASTSKHGLLLKLDNVVTNFLNGQGAWSAPAGGSALSSKLISALRAMDAANGDVSYTGVGFQPTAMIALGQLNTSNISVGLTDQNLAELAVGIDVGSSYTMGGAFVLNVYEDAGKYQTAVLKTFDADGFTLTWTKGGAPASVNARIYFLCLK